MSAPVSLEPLGAVAVLRMQVGENQFNPSTLDAIGSALEEVERDEAIGALVLTGAERFFSNGLDLAWMGAAPPGGAEEVLGRTHALFARLLAFPTATVAAVNGHAFAAGAMLALACDARVMRADRGYFCLPEVDLGLVFTPGMTALIRARLPAPTAHEAMLAGRRYGGEDALAAGIVHEAVPAERVLEAAVERAAALGGKQRGAVAGIKRSLYGEVLDALALPPVLANGRQ
jgi:enoyl-CoA hydratase/carnithine racemase